MKNNNARYYLMDFLITFLAIFGVVMFFPMLPNLQKIFAVSVMQISWLPNIGYITMIAFSPYVAKVIGKLGAKKTLLMMLSIWIMGLALEIISIQIENYSLFVTGRLVEGLGEASFFPIILYFNKMVMREVKTSKIGSSLIEIGSAIGGLVAAILAGYFLDAPQKLLIIPIIMGVASIIFVSILIKPISPENEEREQEVDRGALNNSKIYISLLLLIFITQLVFGSSQIYVAYYLESFQVVHLAGKIISLQQIFVATGALLPIIVLNKMQFEKIEKVVLGTFIIGLLVLAMHITLTISIIALLMVCFSTGINFTILNVKLAQTVRHKISQKMSLYTSIRFLGGFVVSLTAGKILQLYKIATNSYTLGFKILYLSIVVAIMIISVIINFLQREPIVKNQIQVVRK